MIIGIAPGWEPDLPPECAFGQWNDRQFTFSNLDLTLGPYYFGSCEISESNEILGDVNADGLLNVLDVVLIVAIVLEGDNEINQQADINNDGNIDVLDVVQLVNIIIN